MANRAQRRKTKDNLKKPIISNYEENKSGNLWIMIIVVVILVVGFYYLTVFLADKVALKNTTTEIEETKTNAVIQYDEILAGSTFNMSDSNYYVIFYDTTAVYNSTYTTLVTDYNALASHKKIYSVDLNNGMNKSYISDSSNINTSDISLLKIKKPTLIEIKDGNNILSAEGITSIKAILGL